MSRLSDLHTQWAVTIRSGRQLVECPRCGHAITSGQEWKLGPVGLGGEKIPVHANCEQVSR